jgi:hypothetical protein
LAEGNEEVWGTEDGDFRAVHVVEYTTYEGKQAYKMEDSDGDTYYVHAGEDGIWEYIEGCGWIQLLPATMSIGQTFSNPVECDSEKVTIFVTLEGVEEVSVPAGNFSDALKFRVKFTDPSGAEVFDEEYHWFVKGIGEVKYLEDDGYWEKLWYAKVNGKTYGQIPDDFAFPW